MQAGANSQWRRSVPKQKIQKGKKKRRKSNQDFCVRSLRLHTPFLVFSFVFKKGFVSY
jgi:hypothetical protein